MKKLNDLLTEVSKVRASIKEVQDTEKTLKAQQKELESQILLQMEEQGLDKISNQVCTITRKTEIVPTATNWDAIYEHVEETKQWELLHRRLSATAYRELVALGIEVPGITSTELTRLNFRST